MSTYLINLYQNTVLRKPVITLIITALVMAFFFSHVSEFELDASADSLILENDAALNYYREVRENYGSDDFLIVTYSPKNPLFDENTLEDILELREQLKAIEHVESVVTLLDVPLVSSPPISLVEMSKQTRTLESEDVDIDLAKKELSTSPLYQNLLVSSDAGTTALQVNLKQNRELSNLKDEREALFQQKPLPAENRARIDALSEKIKKITLLQNEKQDRAIAQVREVMDKHRSEATLFLGGVPMIVSDSIDFIRSDLNVFGVGVIAFIVVILAVSFGSLRWVILPLTACLASALIMVGYLGLVQWPVTVVSSNFISLLLIITLSLVIHLIVRYREVAEHDETASQFQLISETVRSKFVPCIYTAVTTMVAFGSLLVSGIRPVIDFGWMMVIGISISFILAFTLFPAALILMKRSSHESKAGFTTGVMSSLANFIQRNSNLTLLLFIVLAAIGLSGLPQLSVENRFIDYYKEDTEIYQGMTLIDDQLGGTTPMDVIIDAPKSDFADDEFANDGDITSSSYWFNSYGLLEVAEIHKYLESLPETGKVLSIHTAMQLLEELNDGEPYTDFKLAVVYKRLPPDVKEALIDPYLSENGNQLRFSIRIYESDKSLQRQALLDKIRKHLTTELDLKPEQVNLSGMAVLYNNLLQSLFQSQILTIGAVFFAILIMFIILFRAIKLSIATIIPNMVAAGLILGLMGWIGIPLDIMTITIAAISIGIGVDDSIHYVHRFREEYAVDNDYWAAIKRSHRSIGHALYYTTVTVVLGFSILVLSNFIPTIYFGVLSGLAMTTALLANLMLLPVLIAKFKLH
jgi:predicted RND superfamily exporter protein